MFSLFIQKKKLNSLSTLVQMFFLFEKVENDIKVTLKSGVLTDTIRERFRIPIAFCLLKAFVAESTLKTLR